MNFRNWKFWLTLPIFGVLITITMLSVLVELIGDALVAWVEKGFKEEE